MLEIEGCLQHKLANEYSKLPLPLIQPDATPSKQVQEFKDCMHPIKLWALGLSCPVYNYDNWMLKINSYYKFLLKNYSLTHKLPALLALKRNLAVINFLINTIFC